MYSALQPSHFHFNELNELYLSTGMRTFGQSLIGIFIPIYLYSLGYSAPLVFGFYFMQQVFKFLLVITTCKLVGRLGGKHVIALGYLFITIDFLLLLTMPTYHWPLSLVALVGAVATNFLWIAYHIHFSAVTDRKHRGKQIGAISLVIGLVTSFGPYIGGIVATHYSITYVFIGALCIILLASWPLFRTKETIQRMEIDPGRIRPKIIWRDMVSFAGLGVSQTCDDIAWPLYIFLFFGSYETVGLISTIGFLVTLGVISIVSHYSDRGARRKILSWATRVSGLTNLLRLFTGGLTSIVVVNSASKIAQESTRIPYYSEFYTHADREGRIEYILLTELAIDAMRAFFWGVLVVLSLTLPLATSLKVGFVIAAVATLYIGRIRPQPTAPQA